MSKATLAPGQRTPKGGIWDPKSGKFRYPKNEPTIKVIDLRRP